MKKNPKTLRKITSQDKRKEDIVRTIKRVIGCDKVTEVKATDDGSLFQARCFKTKPYTRGYFFMGLYRVDLLSDVGACCWRVDAKAKPSAKEESPAPKVYPSNEAIIAFLASVLFRAFDGDVLKLGIGILKKKTRNQLIELYDENFKG